ICPAGARPASLPVLIGSQANERARVILSKSSQVAAAMLLESTIVCPRCNHAALETMPTDACQFFYDCKGCGQRLKPRPGDCCVFCSFGSVPCPPIQAGECCP